VILDDDGDMAMLTVRDDGVGPGADALAADERHGLRLLRERARTLGGNLILVRTEQGGAMLQMTLPRELPA
jgi:signal transduction histidine kinase